MLWPTSGIAGASAFVFIRLYVEPPHIDVGTCGGTPTAGRLPVGLLAQQRFTEPVELGDHLLRRRGDGLTGPVSMHFRIAARTAGGPVIGEIIQL